MQSFKRYRNFVHLVVFCLVFSFLGSAILPASYAQMPGGALTLLGLPGPGNLLALSDAFSPPMMYGLKVFPDEPLRFDFIMDKGGAGLDAQALRVQYAQLMKYFLTALTVPEEDMWVNLSPAEPDRIVPEAFGQTEMGRDLLAQDYLLKQLTASLMNPDEEIGKEFWKRVRKEIQEKYGDTDVPVDTFNKVWIVPDEATVYTKGNVAFITRSHLKVMLEEDYILTENHSGAPVPQIPSAPVKILSGEPGNRGTGEQTKEIIREIIIPELEREVNEGKHFAPLRQVFHAMILATWFKKHLKESFLGKVYVGQKRIGGVDVEDKEIKEKIYAQYLEDFKTGVYDFIREEYDESAQQVVPRRYFSGGVLMSVGPKAAFNAGMDRVYAETPVPPVFLDARDFDFQIVPGRFDPTGVEAPARAVTDHSMLGQIAGDRKVLINQMQGYLDAIDLTGENPRPLRPEEQENLRRILELFGFGYLSREDLRAPDLLLTAVLVILRYNPDVYQKYLTTEFSAQAFLSQRIVAQLSMDSGHLLNPVIFPAMDFHLQVFPYREGFTPADQGIVDALMAEREEIMAENFALSRVLKDFIVFQDAPMSVFLLEEIKAHLDAVEEFNTKALTVAGKYAVLNKALSRFADNAQRFIRLAGEFKRTIDRWETHGYESVVEGFNPYADTEGSLYSLSKIWGLPIRLTTQIRNKKQPFRFSKYELFNLLNAAVEYIVGNYQIGRGFEIGVEVNLAVDGRETWMELVIRHNGRDAGGDIQEGMAEVRRIAEHNDGRLAMDSSEVQGTTFRITLPLQKDEAPGTRPADGAMLAGRSVVRDKTYGVEMIMPANAQEMTAWQKRFALLKEKFGAIRDSHDFQERFFNLTLRNFNAFLRDQGIEPVEGRDDPFRIVFSSPELSQVLTLVFEQARQNPQKTLEVLEEMDQKDHAGQLPLLKDHDIFALFEYVNTTKDGADEKLRRMYLSLRFEFPDKAVFDHVLGFLYDFLDAEEEAQSEIWREWQEVQKNISQASQYMVMTMFPYAIGLRLYRGTRVIETVGETVSYGHPVYFSLFRQDPERIYQKPSGELIVAHIPVEAIERFDPDDLIEDVPDYGKLIVSPGTYEPAVVESSDMPQAANQVSLTEIIQGFLKSDRLDEGILHLEDINALFPDDADKDRLVTGLKMVMNEMIMNARERGIIRIELARETDGGIVFRVVNEGRIDWEGLLDLAWKAFEQGKLYQDENGDFHVREEGQAEPDMIRITERRIFENEFATPEIHEKVLWITGLGTMKQDGELSGFGSLLIREYARRLGGNYMIESHNRETTAEVYIPESRDVRFEDAAMLAAVEFDKQKKTASWNGTPMRFVGEGGIKMVFERQMPDGSTRAVSFLKFPEISALGHQIRSAMRTLSDFGVMPRWLSEGETKDGDYYFESEYVKGFSWKEGFDSLMPGEEGEKKRILEGITEVVDILIFAGLDAEDVFKPGNLIYGRIHSEDPLQMWLVDPDLVVPVRGTTQELAAEYLSRLNNSYYDSEYGGLGFYDTEGVVREHLERIIAGRVDVSLQVISRLAQQGRPLPESLEESVINGHADTGYDFAMLAKAEVETALGRKISHQEIAMIRLFLAQEDELSSGISLWRWLGRVLSRPKGKPSLVRGAVVDTEEKVLAVFKKIGELTREGSVGRQELLDALSRFFFVFEKFKKQLAGMPLVDMVDAAISQTETFSAANDRFALLMNVINDGFLKPGETRAGLAEKLGKDPSEWSDFLMPRRAPMKKQGQIKVLVVDDYASDIEAVAGPLSQQGFLVVSATNGRAALEQVEKEQPDFIVTDWFMPQMDGIQLIRELQKRYPQIPMVLRSGDLGGGGYYDRHLGGFIRAAFSNVIGVSGKVGEKDVALKQVAEYFSASDSAMLVQEFEAPLERYRVIQQIAREMGIDTSAIADESPDRDLFPVMQRRTFLKALVFAGGAFALGNWGRAAADQAYVGRQQHVHVLGHHHNSPEVMGRIFEAARLMEKIMEGRDGGDEASVEMLKQLIDGLSKTYADDIARYRLTAGQMLKILDSPGAQYRYISTELTPEGKMIVGLVVEEVNAALQKAVSLISKAGDSEYEEKADNLLLITHTPEFYLRIKGELSERNVEIIAGEDERLFLKDGAWSKSEKSLRNDAEQLVEKGEIKKADVQTLGRILDGIEIYMPWAQRYRDALPSRFSSSFPSEMVKRLIQLNKERRNIVKERNEFIAPHIAAQDGDVLVLIGGGHLEDLKKLFREMQHVTVTESQDSYKAPEKFEEFKREWEKKWGPVEGDSAMLVKKFYTPVERHRAIEQAAGLMGIEADVVEVPDRDFPPSMGRRDFLKAAVFASGAFTIGNWGCATTRQTYVARRQQVHLLWHQHVTPTTIVAIAEAKVEWEKILADREIPESSKIDRLRESIDGLSQEFADDIKRYRATAGQILDILDKPGAHYRYISSEVTPRDKALAEKLMKEFDAVLRKIVSRISKAGYPDYAKKADDLFLVAISPEFYLWFKGELRRRKVSIIAGEDAQLFEESEVPFTTAGFLLDQSRRLVVEDRATEEDAKTLEELINGYEILMPWNQAYIDKLPSRFSSVFPAHMYKWLVNLNNDMREMAVEKRNAFIASHIGSQNADVLVVIGWLHVTGLKERLGQMENVTVEESRAPSQVIDDMIEFQKMWKDGSRLGGDGAMLGSKAPGGIDMSPSKMNLREEGEAVDFVVPPGLEDFENLPITGFTPVILDIIPVADISLLLASAE